MNEIQNIFRASPRIVLIASILAYIISTKLIALRFAGYFAASELLALSLKKIVGTTLSTTQSIYRPVGAGKCIGCGTFATCADKCIDVTDHVGMPSGHSLTIAMSATFWCMQIWNSKDTSKASKIVRSALLIVLALMIVGSRTFVLEGCHTIPHVTIGAALGIALGIAFYKFDKYIQQHFPTSIGR